MDLLCVHSMQRSTPSIYRHVRSARRPRVRAMRVLRWPREPPQRCVPATVTVAATVLVPRSRSRSHLLLFPRARRSRAALPPASRAVQCHYSNSALGVVHVQFETSQ